MSGNLPRAASHTARLLADARGRLAALAPTGTRRRRLLVPAGRILGTVTLFVLAVWLTVAQPSFRRNRPSTATVDRTRLRDHVLKFTTDLHPRDALQPDHLDQCAEYIAGHFRSAGATVESQEVSAFRHPYRNVIGRFGPGGGPRVIVGAHYDACDGTPGADDNASGVAALIELAYLLGQSAPDKRVELVAYVLEEPPFFRTPDMGSAVHARSVAAGKEEISGVIVFEMVGYFSDAWGSQSYPSLLLRLLYPGRANFIAVVGPWNQGAWVKAVKAGMQAATPLPVYSIRAPTIVPGVDFSDHINYWPYGISALMVTDTAFYRNRAYHTAADTANTLDYKRLGEVVVAVFEAIRAR
jgi:hypothetical protein